MSDLLQWIQGAGAAAPLAFIGAYAAATVLFVPGSALTLAGGAMFGPLAGALYSLTGATLGASAAFLVSRHVAREAVARMLRGRAAALARSVDGEGWRFVVFVRLVPLLPFNALNYALGLTRIPVWQYAAASYAAMLPGAAAYAYLGYAGREALGGADDLIGKGLIAAALLAAAVYLPHVVRRLRRNGISGPTRCCPSDER